MSPQRGFVPGTADQRRRERWALGLAAGAVVFALSYSVQRLVSLVIGEPAFAEVLRAAHTAFYWRVVIAALQGGLTVPVVAAVVPEIAVRPLLRFGPLWVISPVMVFALALVAFP